ncbi:MAG: hypothetical protein Q9168_006963 [Polycauliona sp. 1 TL-2023]
MAFAQPAIKNQFLYNGDFFIDVGNANRHKRASVAEITEVLRPDLKKPKNAAATKDPVGHWYEAQLIHYGLPPSKDKARAKMRLLENLNQSNLIIPPHVTTIESELKKIFNAAERKAKAQHKASLAATQSVQKDSASTKKRKVSANQNPTTTINVNVSMGEGYSPQRHSPPPPKKRKPQTARRGGSTSVPPFELTHAALQGNTPTTESFKPRPKQTARRGGSKNIPPSELTHAAFQREPTTAENAKPRPKQTARRTASSSLSYRPNTASSHVAPHANSASEAVGLAQFPSSKTDVKPKKEPKPRVKKEPKVMQEPPARKGPSIKTDPDAKKKTIASPSRSSGTAPLGLINGIYEISCPAIESEWDYDGFTLVLTLDSPSIWAEYDFGMFTGILFIPQRPYSASNDTFQFQWRGRENSEGQMSFGDNCVGEISFLGNGRIEGWINLYGEARFEGVRQDGPGTAIRSAKDMREEWDGYNDEEYEHERVGRWH